MSDTDNSEVENKNNTTVDPQGNITVDFTNELLPMTPNSTITVKLGELLYTFKPISTIVYYKYNEVLDAAELDPAKEKSARDWLVASCMIKPKMTQQEVAELPIGLFWVLFNTLMNKSFLLPND